MSTAVSEATVIKALADHYKKMGDIESAECCMKEHRRLVRKASRSESNKRTKKRNKRPR